MLRKDVRIAWNLIHILNDEYEKICSLALRLNELYSMNTTSEEMRHVVRKLAKVKIVETRKGVGVRRALRPVIRVEDILEALEVTYKYDLSSPAGRLQFKIKEVLRQTEFNNSKILHKIK